MFTAELVSDIEGDRRVHPRIEFERPCKIFSPQLQRYFLGTTRDLSAGGMLIHVGHLVDIRPGDVLHVGVAAKRRDELLRANEMLEATVVRSMSTVDDHTTFAVRFDEEQSTVGAAALRLAA